MQTTNQHHHPVRQQSNKERRLAANNKDDTTDDSIPRDEQLNGYTKRGTIHESSRYEQRRQEANDTTQTGTTYYNPYQQ
ncbi:hypothetical protein HUG17_4908 [Dermatophagoides farinae]|uniref:Uncharacterized protein n=1 Tax=Dermatophagoides farinae TaxID=6954 RepID=A0A9D4P0V1_DERFA|nr:hypothetical protein HUG17_4908 [Dermatophagoides farinae]